MLLNPTPVATPAGQKNYAMAVDPTNPNNLLTAYEGSGHNFRQTAYGRSTDAGRTWAMDAFSNTWGPDEYTPFGEVNVAYDGTGVGFLTSLAIADTDSAIFVLTTTDGLSWSPPVSIIGAGREDFRSMNSLAADQRTSGQYAGSAYAFWLYTDSTLPYWEGIRGSYSRDKARTWAPELQISDPGHNYAYNPVSAVASDGTVYVAWNYRPENLISTQPDIYMDRSTDGGQTWGEDRRVSGASVTPIGGPDFKYRELVLVVPRYCNYLRINMYPSIAVSPTDPNTVYAVWNDGRWDQYFQLCGTAGQHSDIAFTKSTDGGTTWAPPTKVNADPSLDGVDQFQPTIAVAPDGTVGVTFYDMGYAPDHMLFDLSYRQSTDGGTTWSTTQRISDMSSDPDRLQDFKLIDDVGYKKSLVYGDDYAVASWIDTRLGDWQGDFFIDRGTVGGTPTATVTTTVIATGTSTSTPEASASPSVTACSMQFTDVLPSNVFYPYIQCLACRGILSGYPCGGEGEPCDPNNNPYFRTYNNVTRGQLSKIVSNAAGWQESHTEQSFEDIPPGSTFHQFIERLFSRNVIQGYPCGGEGEPCGPGNRPYFRPGNNSTRGQISKIVSNARGWTDPPGEQIFEDVPPAYTFYDFIQRLASRGYISGYPCGQGPGEPCNPPGDRPYFRPGNNTIRGQLAKIASNAFFPECSP
jgi:hypothetical protein